MPRRFIAPAIARATRIIDRRAVGAPVDRARGREFFLSSWISRRLY
jgi:hypothetical protein